MRFSWYSLFLAILFTLFGLVSAQTIEDCQIAVAGSDVIFLIREHEGQFEIVDEIEMMGLVEWNEGQLMIYDLENLTLWQYENQVLTETPTSKNIELLSFFSVDERYVIAFQPIPDGQFFIQDRIYASNQTALNLSSIEAGTLFSWSPDGQLVATITLDASENRQIIIIDTSNGQIVQSYPIEIPDSLLGSRANVTPELTWSTDGNYLTLASFNYLWTTIPVDPIVVDIERERMIPLDLGSQFYIVGWTSENDLIYGSENQLISIDIDHPENETFIFDVQDETYNVDGAELSPQARYVAYFYIENSRTLLYVRDLETGEDIPFVSDLFIRDIAWHSAC